MEADGGYSVANHEQAIRDGFGDGEPWTAMAQARRALIGDSK
jgi:hypothetical protein